MTRVMRPFLHWVPVSHIKPHEAIREGKAAGFHRFASKKRRLYTKPILIDASTGVILDGHHRFAVCKELGCTLVPCVAVDYLNDPHITVLPRRPDIPVSKADVIAMGISGNTFPPKTTRHVFSIPLMERQVPLTRHRSIGQ